MELKPDVWLIIATFVCSIGIPLAAYQIYKWTERPDTIPSLKSLLPMVTVMMVCVFWYFDIGFRVIGWSLIIGATLGLCSINFVKKELKITWPKNILASMAGGAYGALLLLCLVILSSQD